MIDKNLFSDIDFECCMGYDYSNCLCSHTEMAIRKFSNKNSLRIMTENERQQLIDSASYCGEGYYTEKELSEMNDKELANATIRSWQMYSENMY